MFLFLENKEHAEISMTMLEMCMFGLITSIHFK